MQKATAVQVLTRIKFEDGKVATLMLPMAPVGLSAGALIEEQMEAIKEHIGQAGLAEIYKQATAPMDAKREEVIQRAQSAEDLNRKS